MALSNTRRPFHELVIDPISPGDRIVVRGTNGNDMLTGTTESEIFKPKMGIDRVDGALGNDVLSVDYSKSELSIVSIGTTISVDAISGIYGTLTALDSRCSFLNIEQLKFISSGSDDRISMVIGQNSALTTGMFDIDGGGGQNYIELGGAFLEPLLFEMQENGIVYSSLGTFRNFSSYELLLGSGDDVVTGLSGNFYGRLGNDNLTGGILDDWFVGGAGADILTGGGGADSFRYEGAGESAGTKSADTITDFHRAEGDEIALIFDADRTQKGYQHFTFIGEAAFSGAAAELRFTDNGDGTYTVQGNIDLDVKAEFVLIVHADAPLIATDFSL